MSETSIGSDDRIQCLAIVLHRCVGDNERSVEELANELLNKKITNKVEDKLIFDSIAEKDYGKALNQMVKSVANAEGGIGKFPTYLRESGMKDQVVTLVEKVVAAEPHSALIAMVKSWNQISSREENFKREIQNTWPDKVESLTRDWPIRFMIFCSDGITQDGANRLLSSTSDDEGAQIPAGGEVNPALMSGDTSGNQTESFEEPPVPDESNQLDSFVVIDEDDLKPRGDLSTPTSTEYAPKASEYNSETEVDNLTEQKEYCQDDFEDPDHEPDFLIERYDEIETSRDILLPIVMIIWPEIIDDESWPADLISIASEDGNEQARDQLINIIQYIFQKKKDMCDFEPLPYLDMGAAEQWIHNFEKYFNQSDEQVHVMKMLLEISWTELINIQPDMWKNELVKKYQSDPCRATNFINASKILFGLIQEKIVDNPSHPSGESNEYSASEMSVDLSSIVGMLSESADSEDLSDFVTNNYDTLESLRILLLPIIELIWPGDSELINEESWLEEMMSRETNTENQLFHHQFIKICGCLFELRKASPMIQPSLIAEPQRAWDWMQEAFQKFTNSQNALLILSFFIKIRWPSFESTEPGEWMNFLQKQDSADQEGFLVFANATKILLDLLQACEIERNGESKKDPNFRPEEAFLKNKYEEILVARDILAPIIILIWPKDTRLAEGDNWLNELVADVSNAENRTPGQHFIQACQCVIDLIKEAAEFQAPQIMDAKAARAWMLANSSKMINFSEHTAELDMIFQLAWPNIEKIQRTEWTKIFLRQYKLDITTATNFANAARIILELIEVTKRDGTNEQTLWKKEELSPELKFFIDNYEALHDSDVLLLPIACLVWSSDLIKFKENDDWLDELIARIASEEDESSVQNFIELSRQVMDLKKEISDMTLIQTHTIDLNEARAWIINHPRIFKKTEQMAMVFNRLLCIGWPQTETTHDMDIIVRIWTQILLEKHKSDTSKVTEFVNAADVFLQLHKVSEKVDESEEEEFQELASFLNENYDEISASREILLPTMKFTWPVLFNSAETVNNWPDEIIASIFENEDIDRSKPFMKLCYWILNIKKQAPEFKVPQIYETMDVPIIRKWIIQKTKIFRKSETRIELFNALLALGALNLESCIPETWSKSLLKKVKTEAARLNDLIYNAGLILKLIEVEESLAAKAEKSHTRGQTLQTPGTPTQPLPIIQNAQRTQEIPKTQETPQTAGTSPIKQNASRTHEKPKTRESTPRQRRNNAQTSENSNKLGGTKAGTEAPGTGSLPQPKRDNAQAGKNSNKTDATRAGTGSRKPPRPGPNEADMSQTGSIKTLPTKPVSKTPHKPVKIDPDVTDQTHTETFQERSSTSIQLSPSPTFPRRSNRIRAQRHSSESGLDQMNQIPANSNLQLGQGFLTTTKGFNNNSCFINDCAVDGSIDITSHAGQEFFNSRYQQDSATLSTSAGNAETGYTLEQRSFYELWKPSVRSSAMDIRENQVESAEIIIRVAVSGVQPDEKVCIVVGRDWLMMNHLENSVYTITLPWENALVYWFNVYNSKTCQSINETNSGARSVYSYNSESYVFDVAYFHKAEPTISPRYWGELLSKFLPSSGNDIFTSTLLKSELIGWLNQITGGWNIAGQKKYVGKQTYENCLIGWLQILKNEEKLMGTLALMIAMKKLKCKAGDELMKCIVEGLYFNFRETDKQRQLHQLIATIFLDKYLSPENLSEMIIELLQSCYLTNPKWLLALPLCHFVKQDRHSLSNAKPDEARQSAFFLDQVSENVMKNFQLPKKYSTSNYQDCLVELAPQIQEIQTSHPWITHIYQNTLKTDSVIKLLKDNAYILKSFRLEQLLIEIVKLIEKRLKSREKDKASKIINQSQKLFEEIFHYAKINEFDRKFTEDKIEYCVAIMMAMLATLSASLKKFDRNHKIYIFFSSKIASLISFWSTMLIATNEKFTDDSTSRLVLDFQSYVLQKVAMYDPSIKKNLQFFDNLLRIKWPEKYRKQWVELIQVEINIKIDEKWEHADEKYFKFFTQTILESSFCDELEHCFSEKALDIAAGVLNEDQDYEPYFCGLSAILSSQKNTSVTKFIEKLFNKEIKTRGIDEKTSTKNILKFICEWPISLSIFKFIYSNNALEISPSANHTINMIERRCKEFLDTLQKGNVLRDDLNVVREYHSKLCQFLQTMFPKIVGTGTKTLEINIGKMQAKLEQFIKELNNYKTFCKMCLLIKERHVNYSKLKEVYERSVQSNRLDGLFTIEDVKTNPGGYSGLTVAEMKQFEMIQMLKKSQIFLNLWVEVSQNLKETQDHVDEMDWKEVLSSVWTSVKHEICSLVDLIQKESLKLDVAIKHFYWSNGERKIIYDELQKLYNFKKRLDDSENAVYNLNSAVSSISNVCEIKKNSKSLKWILDFVKIQQLKGDFEDLNKILNTEENIDLTLNDIDENTLEKFPKQLRDMEPSKLAVLKDFIEQRELIEWLQNTKMTDVSEVKVMCDLALSSTGETPVETDKILHLLDATQCFAPLLFHLEDVNCLDELLEKCAEVWENVDQDNRILEKWKSSGDNLEWLKDRESLVGSDQKQSLALAQSINERGLYTVGITKIIRPTLENCVSLTIQDTDSTPKKGKNSGKYDLPALQDLQSKLALIAGEEDQGQQDIAQFVELFTVVKTLAEAFVNLTNAGCMLFNDFTAMISSSLCNDINDRQNEHNLKITIHFMEQSAPLSGTTSLYVLQELSKTLRLSYDQWTDYINSKRLKHYHLNEYNIQQITYLCHQLATVENTALLPDQVLSLLSNDSKSLASGIIQEARDQAIKINDEEPDEEEMGETERNIDGEDSMSEMEKKKRTLRILVNRERLPEHLAKAAIQAVGYDNIDECNNWVLLYQYDENEVQSNLKKFNAERAFAHQSNEEEELTSILDNKSMHSLTEMIDQIINTLNVDESEPKIVGAVKTICKRYFEKTKVLTMQDYLSVEHLGKFLTHLHENHDIKHKVVRDLEAPLEKGRPNLIVCQEAEIIPTLLSLYMKNRDQPLPTASEVLLCSKQTTSDEVERFMRRALCKCKSNGQPLFCMAFTEKLKPKVSNSVEDIFEELMQQQRHLNTDYQLVVLSGSQQHYISECFDKHQIQLEKKESFEKDISNYLKMHLSTTDNEVGPFIVKIVEADRSGIGKSLYVKDLSKQLDKRWFEKCSQIEHMHAFLNVLKRDANNVVPKRSLPVPMEKGKFNIIFTPEADILPALLSLYMADQGQPLPIASEVLLCCQQTSEEEVERFLRRAMCKTSKQDKRLFTIAYGERIRPEVVKRIEKLSESLSTNMHASEEYQLAILTSDMTSFEWCRHHRVFQVAEDSAHSNSEKISLYLDNKSIGSYESVRLTPATKVEELQGNDTYSTGDAPDIWHKTTIRLLEKTINTDPILDRLYQSAHIHNEDNHFIHLDLTPAVENGIERFMFNLLVLGSIQDNRGRVWNRQKQHLYIIEMTRSELNRQQISKNSILNMLPRVKCLSPLESLEKLRNVRLKTFEVLKQHLSVSNPNTDGYEEIKKVHECVNHNAKYLLSEYQYEEQNVIGMDYMTDLLNYSGFPNSVIPLIIKMIPEDKYEEFKNIHDEEGLQNIMLMAYKEFISSTFQRPYQYLKHAAVKDINLDDFQYREPEGNQEDCIETFLNSYVSDNPTWAQLRHFASFMNVQLKNCEECIFCQKVSTGRGQIWQDTELRGLKDFAVKFMIRMSQDFATPSMQIADQSSKDVDETTDSLASHQVRREWEGKSHPYLFFNEDRTMTFINVALNRSGDLLDEDANILEKNIASKKLMQGLHAQRLEFEFNFQEKSRIEKLNTLRTIMGLPPSTDDPDPTYELTTDNVLKILAIYMRLKCNIPVIVMGETGCGKTRMVEFMSKLRAAGNENVQNMVTLKVHGGVIAEDIYRSVAKANKIAKENAARNISTVLFYDEANTTTAIHAIKEVVCDNTINGKSFYDRKLEIVAACNPYKSLSEKAIQVLENSGLGYRVSASETTNCFGKIPIRRLVYKVVPLPPSMQPFVWDFGQLSVESEQRYIHQMTKHLAGKLKLDDQDKNLIDYILCSAQSYMKVEMKDECRYVSLRDVERCLIFFHFFHDQQEFLFPRIEHKLGEEQPKISTTLRCLIQTIGVCYHVSLYNRQKFREHISKCLKKKQITLSQRQINEELVACQNVFLGNLKIERNIAPNEALCENVYLITICCELRIPLFLVGKPGSSKSLAKTIVSNNMEGKKSKSPLFKRLKKIKMISYQCSALTDAAGIKQKFKECSDLQKGDKDLNSYSAVVVLDEIGLAEDSPNMPLKVLHPLLECGSTESGTIAETKPTDKVGFVGISNWALDPAKMNRGIFVTRSTPNEKDLLATAKSIMQKQNHFMAEEIEILDGLTKAYLNIYHNQRYKQESKEYFGLRDYYSMIKMINATSEDKDKCEFKDIAYAVQRNFSGGHESHFKALTTAVKKQYIFEDDVAEKSVTDMIKDNLKENDSRFLLLLTNQNSSVSMLEHLIEDFHKNVQIIFGSSFAGDHTYTEICKNINRIKVCMEAGRTVVLLDMTEVHESLYDALNQHYTIYGGQRYVDIGLGGHRVKCRIANNFRLVVMEKKDFVYQHYPIPLVNRLEKHHLESINLLNNSQLHVSENLKTWCQTFAKVDNFNEKDAFLGYHDNTSSSVILARDKIRDIELYKGVLLQSVATDAMFRAKLPEKERLMDIYTREQVHDNLLNLLNHTFGTSKKNLTVLEITSFSNILTTKDRQKLESSLFLKQNSIMLLSLLLFDTQQEYLSNLEKFFKSEVSQEKKILLVQCPQAQRHGSLIACAKYGLTNMIKDITKQEHGCQIIVAFLLSIQRQHSSHTEKQSQLMLQHTKSVEIVYVDDLRPPGAGNVIVSRFYEKKLTDVLRMGQQEIDEQARMHQEGINFIALLKDSICQAMSRIRRKNETDARNLQCIEYITSICSQNPALRGKFLSIMANCMTEIYEQRDSDGSLAMSSNSWMTKEALSPIRLQEGGTFGKTLCLCLKRHLSDLLAFIISCIDENNNLDFVLNNDYKQWQTELWFDFFRTLKLEWKKMQGRHEFNVHFENHLTKTFSPQFPFSYVLNSIFCKNWSTLQDEDSATRLKIFNNMFSERPEAKVIADACEHNKDEIVRAYATDALTCNFNFGNIEESVKARLVDILLNIFHSTKNEPEEFQSHNVVTLVYSCLQEYLPHLCMICEIFKISPGISVDTDKWIEEQEGIDDFVIHSLALKKLLEWLREYHIADDASCVEWMSLTNRCKRIYHGNRQLITDEKLKDKISERWEPISLLDLLLLQLLPNADDELFTNYVKVIVNHAKRLLNPLQRYGSRHKNFLKILSNVLRKSYEDIKLKLLVSWQDLSCRRCRKILAKEPVVLPCNHFMCKDCTDEMFAATETRKQCPQCSEKMPDDFRTDQAKLTEQQESLLQKFRSNCTSFFLEYLSQFCFSSKEHDMKDHAKLFLYELIMETSINQERLELETLALDLNIATKSKIFQLLMQHHSDLLEKEINNLFLNITGDSNLTSKQLKDLITVVLTAYEAEVKVGDWENFESIWRSVGKSTNISLRVLRMLATLRNYIHQYMGTSDVRKIKETIKPNLHALIDICASDETDALSTFAVKSGCQMFGTEWFDFICNHNRLKHLVPNKMKRIMNDKVIDSWLILGEEYATMREILHRMSHENYSEQLRSCFSDGNDITKLLPKILAVISFANNQYIEASKEQMSRWMENTELLFAVIRTLGIHIPGTSKKQSNILKQLLILTGSVVICQPRLLQNFCVLCTNPADVEKLFWPGMPVSMYFSIREALQSETQVAVYACPNGHPYIIGECTRPWIESKCPACGETIGGRLHVAAEGNERIEQTEESQAGYQLNSDTAGKDDPSDRMSKQGVALVHFIIHCCMLVGLEHDEEIISRMLNKDSPQESRKYLHSKLQENIETFANAMGRNMDDAIMIIHSCFKSILNTKLDDENEPDWNSMNSRCDWEAQFREKYLLPVFQNVDAAIAEAQQNINAVEKLENMLLYRIVNEVATEEQPDQLVWYHPLFWKTIKHPNASHLLQYVRDSASTGRVLKIILESPDLHLLQHMENVLTLQKMFINRYQNQIDMKQAEEITLIHFMDEQSDYRQRVQIENDIGDYIKFWNSIYGMFRQHPDKQIKEYLKDIDVFSPISMALPSSRGRGKCAKLLAEYLIDIHNNFLEKCSSALKITNGHTVEVARLGSNFIRIDKQNDLLPLIRMHTSYTITEDELGNHHQISYNIDALEKQVREKYVTYQPRINKKSLPCMKYPQDVGVGSDWDNVLENIPQDPLSAKLSQEVDDLVTNQDVTPADVCEGVRTLTHAISFLAKIKVDRTKTLQKYMEENLLLSPNHMAMIPKSALTCHTLALYQRLMWHKAVNFVQQGLDPYKEALYEVTQEEIEDEDVLRRLKDAFDHTDMNLFQQRVNEMLIKVPDFTPTWSLTENVFPYLEFIEENTPDWYERIPNEICFKHISHLFRLSVKGIKLPDNNNET